MLKAEALLRQGVRQKCANIQVRNEYEVSNYV